jgi:hypothetical protein
VSSYTDTRTGIKWTTREIAIDGLTVVADVNAFGEVVVLDTIVTTPDRSLPEWVYAACEKRIEEQVGEASRG